MAESPEHSTTPTEGERREEAEEEEERREDVAYPDIPPEHREVLEAMQEMERAGTEEERVRQYPRNALTDEIMAYAEGYNPVADSNVRMEREQKEKEEEKQKEEERKREEMEKMLCRSVENRTYAIGTVAVEIPAKRSMCVRILRNIAEEIARGREKEERKEKKEDTDEKEREEEKEKDWRERVIHETMGVCEKLELVLVVEQALAETQTQVELFARGEEVDRARIALFKPEVSVFRKEALFRLVSEERAVMRMEERTNRILYPYSFQRPSDELIACMRCTIVVVNLAAGKPILKECFTVVDRAEDAERVEQGENADGETGRKKERVNRSTVIGPSAERESDPLTPIRHTDRIAVAVDMSGEGHIRERPEEHRTAAKAPERKEEGREVEREKEEASKE